MSANRKWAWESRFDTHLLTLPLDLTNTSPLHANGTQSAISWLHTHLYNYEVLDVEWETKIRTKNHNHSWPLYTHWLKDNWDSWFFFMGSYSTSKTVAERGCVKLRNYVLRARDWPTDATPKARSFATVWFWLSLSNWGRTPITANEAAARKREKMHSRHRLNLLHFYLR